MEILGIGPMELVLILIVALMIFGPDKLPQIGAKLGRGMREMRKATRAISDEINATRDAVTNPAKELVEPLSDVTDVAKTAGSIVAAAKNPTQALKDSVLKELNRPASTEEPAADETAPENTIAPPALLAAETTPPPALPQSEPTPALPVSDETPPGTTAAEPPASPGDPAPPALDAAASSESARAADEPAPAKKRKPRTKKPSPPAGADSAAGEQ